MNRSISHCHGPWHGTCVDFHTVRVLSGGRGRGAIEATSDDCISGPFVHETGQHVARLAPSWSARRNRARASPRRSRWRRPPSAASSTCCSWPIVPAVKPVEQPRCARPHGQGRVKFEPMTILSALAAVTKHLGLVATSTTTFNEPYTLRPPVRLARPDQRRPRRLEIS